LTLFLSITPDENLTLPPGGFFGNSGANSSYDQYQLVVIPEQADFNNTLASYEACTGDMSEG
jgi:hypothetical protein